MSHGPKPRANLKSRSDTRSLKAVKHYTRGRYNKYINYGDEIDKIQNILQNPKYGDCAYIAYEQKIPVTTVKTWKQKIQSDECYDIKSGNKRER